jgi:hypothetical protein
MQIDAAFDGIARNHGGTVQAAFESGFPSPQVELTHGRVAAMARQTFFLEKGQNLTRKRNRIGCSQRQGN